MMELTARYINVSQIPANSILFELPSIILNESSLNPPNRKWDCCSLNYWRFEQCDFALEVDVERFVSYVISSWGNIFDYYLSFDFCLKVQWVWFIDGYDSCILFSSNATDWVRMKYLTGIGDNWSVMNRAKIKCPFSNESFNFVFVFFSWIKDNIFVYIYNEESKRAGH